MCLFLQSVYIFFLIFLFLDETLGKPSEERLDISEGVVQNFIEKDAIAQNGYTDSENEITFKIQSLEESRQDIQETLADLKVLLAKSNRRIIELEARVFELETSEKNRKIMPSLESINENKIVSGLHEKKLRLNTDNLTDNFPPENTTSDVLVRSVHDNTKELHSDITDRRSIQLNGQQFSQKEKRISTDVISFTAYVSVHETEISKGYTIKFDTVVTNIGSHYNRHSGVFTAPQPGVYVFSWNLYCYGDGFLFSQLALNSNVVGAMYTDAANSSYVKTTSNVVVVEVNSGDVIFVRIHPSKDHRNNLFSSRDWRSTFSGWKLH